MFKKANFPKIEERVLQFWKEKEIFTESIKKKKKAKSFVFYEGPPTANGKPGIHHVLTRAFKDIVCRYKTMVGFRVLRKAGWDTHGLPVELQVEKKLGLKSKKDIEKYGISKFNKKCKASVWKYKKDWEKLTERIGFWLDMDNPYITYNPDYIESVWWILKQIHTKGLLYQDFKVVPYCPRCGTALSSHEVAQGYKKIKEPSIFVKLRIKNLEFKKTYLLVWTTTPWTLPGNVAVAINPDFVYAKVKVGEEYLILAKEMISSCGVDGKVVQEFKGKDLLDLRYEGLYPLNSDVSKDAYKVIPGKFVSLKEGTGLVHIAPAYGIEDMDLIKAQNKKYKTQKISEIPILLVVNEEGKFNFDVKKWAGMYFKDANPLITEDLKQKKLLFKEEMYEHDYPFCWRCKTPLLYYARKSWFIRMKKMKAALIKNNKGINWTPAYLRDGRFGEWLKGVRDWALSRERYWGTPLPVWECKKCGKIKVIGSKKELIAQKYTTNTYYFLRHGETIRVADLNRIIYSRKEDRSLGLTEKGRKDIEAVAKKLKRKNVDLIFASDFFRAQKTAKIVNEQLNLKIHTDKRLRDTDLGVFSGGPKEAVYKAFRDMRERFYRKPKGGEDWFSCRKRILSFIKDVEKKHKNKTILIISHGDPLWLLEGMMKGLSMETLVKQKLQWKVIKAGQLKKVKLTFLPIDEKTELDFHKPYIDKVKFQCDDCEGIMERVPEVIDCWFDAGSMPFAQHHYPFENKKLITQKKQFPADFICEAIDQTRGWFYTLLAISTLLEKGSSYKNIISLGHILDKKGEKMSKSKGNIVDPWYIAGKYGIDAVRWYFYTASQPGEPKLFSEKDVGEKLKRFIMTFWNCYVFYNTYTGLSDSERKKITLSPRISSPKSSSDVLDKWIISELNLLIKNTSQLLEEYNITGAARLIEGFIVNSLSLWYVRRSRKRFQRPETIKELKKASQLLGFILLTLSKLTAPFIPFFSEHLYQELLGKKLKTKDSVHLENWPKANEKLIDKKLKEKMEEVRKIVTASLSERAKAGLKVRQPLQKLTIKSLKLKKDKNLLELIKAEINVKEIAFKSSLKENIELDRTITLELREEGNLREIIRNIQQMRKEAGFTAKDTISIRFDGKMEITEFLSKNKKNIIRETKATELEYGQKKKFKVKKEAKLNGEKFWLFISKVRNKKSG